MKPIAPLAGACLLVGTLVTALLSPVAQAAPAYDAEAAQRNWQEGPVPPAPALSTRHLEKVPMPGYSAVTVQVDVDSLTLGQDGVVRYVVLLSSKEGARSAFYQGINCRLWQVRTYERYRFDLTPARWEAADDAWSDLALERSRYAIAIAQNGLCDDATPPISTDDARRRFGHNRYWSNTSW